MEKEIIMKRSAIYIWSLLLVTAPAYAFNSGSTGADGALNITANTTLQVPPSGIFNYTTITVAAGATLTFKANTANTPVVMLATGTVGIFGTIDLDGKGGDSNGTPGAGGPGGFRGGRGGQPFVDKMDGERGHGPGGGMGGRSCTSQGGGQQGGVGASHAGVVNQAAIAACATDKPAITGGPTYGSIAAIPLIGGSGGGGGATLLGNPNAFGGGGGGGAILIATSGSLNMFNGVGFGNIHASGAGGFAITVGGVNSSSGGGSGGTIHLIATSMSNLSTLSASGPNFGPPASGGRVRVDTETLVNSVSSQSASGSPVGTVAINVSPVLSQALPSGLPSLAITSVSGQAAPAVPSGSSDIVLNDVPTGPVTILAEARNLPAASGVKLYITPQRGSRVEISGTLSGSADPLTATFQATLPAGHIGLQVVATYNVTLAMGEALSQYAEGEMVKAAEIVAGLDGTSHALLTTVSGKEFKVPTSVLWMVGVFAENR